MPNKMTDAEYQETQQQLLLMAQMISNMPDLSKFLERINTAESVGPMLDPTSWLKGRGNLDKIKKLARAAWEFQKAAREVAGDNR